MFANEKGIWPRTDHSREKSSSLWVCSKHLLAIYPPAITEPLWGGGGLFPLGGYPSSSGVSLQFVQTRPTVWRSWFVLLPSTYLLCTFLPVLLRQDSACLAHVGAPIGNEPNAKRELQGHHKSSPQLWFDHPPSLLSCLPLCCVPFCPAVQVLAAANQWHPSPNIQVTWPRSASTRKVTRVKDGCIRVPFPVL